MLVAGAKNEWAKSGAEAVLWSSLEMNVGIMCASLLALKPLVTKVLPSWLGTRDDGRDQGPLQLQPFSGCTTASSETRVADDRSWTAGKEKNTSSRRFPSKIGALGLFRNKKSLDNSNFVFPTAWRPDVEDSQRSKSQSSGSSSQARRNSYHRRTHSVTTLTAPHLSRRETLGSIAEGLDEELAISKPSSPPICPIHSQASPLSHDQSQLYTHHPNHSIHTFPNPCASPTTIDNEDDLLSKIKIQASHESLRAGKVAQSRRPWDFSDDGRVIVEMADQGRQVGRAKEVRVGSCGSGECSRKGSLVSRSAEVGGSNGGIRLVGGRGMCDFGNEERRGRSWSRSLGSRGAAEVQVEVDGQMWRGEEVEDRQLQEEFVEMETAAANTERRWSEGYLY